MGDFPPLPPLTSAGDHADRTHTFNAAINLQVPDEFRKGTLTGRIFRNTDHHLTLQAMYGWPFFGQEISYSEETESVRFDWQSLVNLRAAKHFTFGGLEYTGFVDIRNLFGTRNMNVLRTDLLGDEVLVGLNDSGGQTIEDALDYMGIATPDLYVDPSRRAPTDIDGDGDSDDADRAEIIRRLDMNGDGEVTVEEELAMAILSIGAFNDDPENHDIPRFVRIGFEIRF